MRRGAPLTETLHCTSTRHASSRYAGETGRRKPPTPKTENKGGMLMRRACARALSPRSFFAAGVQLSAQNTQPALRTGLMAPALTYIYISRSVILDLTWGILKQVGHSPAGPRGALPRARSTQSFLMRAIAPSAGGIWAWGRHREPGGTLPHFKAR